MTTATSTNRRDAAKEFGEDRKSVVESFGTLGKRKGKKRRNISNPDIEAAIRMCMIAR